MLFYTASIVFLICLSSCLLLFLFLLCLYTASIVCVYSASTVLLVYLFIGLCCVSTLPLYWHLLCFYSASPLLLLCFYSFAFGPLSIIVLLCLFAGLYCIGPLLASTVVLLCIYAGFSSVCSLPFLGFDCDHHDQSDTTALQS